MSKAPLLTVHVRVNDSATGQPCPVRLAILDADGTYRAPLGRLASFATGPGEDVGGNLLLDASPHAYIDGTCEVRLPVGPLTVLASRGPEYSFFHSLLSLRPGQISLRLAIERWIDLRTEGWYAGDLRVHDLSPHAALLEGSAEGLALVQLLARERPPEGRKPPRVNGILAFSGTKPALERPDCQLAVNTLNEHPVLGRVGLLDCHRPVYPLRFGGPDGSDDWSVSDWCDQCHRKRGLVTWPDLPRLIPDSWQGEALAALVLGKVDAFEVSRLPAGDPWVGLDLWYRLLEAGFRPALAGASGKDCNAVPVGNVRTYARLEPPTPFSLPGWTGAVRAGHTFLTSGPLLFLDVNGVGPGAILQAEPGQPLVLRARAVSALPLEKVEILVGGKVVAATACPPTPEQMRAGVATFVEAELVASESTWIAARCSGRETLPGGGCAAAHTSGVFVQVADRPPRAARETLEPLLAALDGTEAWVERQARCDTDRQREHLLGVLRSAREELVRRERE